MYGKTYLSQPTERLSQMTQIFQVVAAEAPQLVDHANRSLYGWVLALSIILMFGGLAAGFYSIAAGKFKEKPASIIGTVVTLLTVVGKSWCLSFKRYDAR